MKAIMKTPVGNKLTIRAKTREALECEIKLFKDHGCKLIEKII